MEANTEINIDAEFIITSDYKFINNEFTDNENKKNSDIPAKVIYAGKTTIAIFEDGERIDAVPMPGDEFDEATGLSMCIAKRVYGTRTEFKKAVKGAIRQSVQPKKLEYFDVEAPF